MLRTWARLWETMDSGTRDSLWNGRKRISICSAATLRISVSQDTPQVRMTPIPTHNYILTSPRRKLRLPPTRLRPPPTRHPGHRPPGSNLLQLARRTTQKANRNPTPIRPAPKRPLNPAHPIRKRKARPSPLPPSKATPRRRENNPNPPISPNNRRRLHTPNPLPIPRRRLLRPQTPVPQHPAHPRRMLRRTFPLRSLVPTQGQYARRSTHPADSRLPPTYRRCFNPTPLPGRETPTGCKGLGLRRLGQNLRRYAGVPHAARLDSRVDF